MISPHNRLKGRWDSFVMLLIVFCAFEIPVRLSLHYPVEGWLLALDWLITLCFGIDLILSFFQSYRVGNVLVEDKRDVAKHYLKTWFLVDFLSTVPFDFIFAGLFGVEGEVLRVLRLMRLARLLKLLKLLSSSSSWESSRAVNQGLIRLVLLVFWVVLLAHWVAAGWLVIADIEKDVTKAQAYLSSLYWSVTTLTTVGYGDITPKTPPQTIYTMLIMFLGVGVYGYVIGNVASLLSNIDVEKARKAKVIEDLNTFFLYREVPLELQGKVKQYYNHLWTTDFVQDESGIMDGLPTSIRTEISLHLNREILEKVPLFKEASEDFIRAIALSLHAEVYMPGDLIIRKGEIGDKMYFISRGSVEVVGDDYRTVLATLQEGSFFGEMAIVLDQSRTASIRTVGFCDIYSLDKDAFQRVLRQFPDIGDKIKSTVEQRLRERGIREASE